MSTRLYASYGLLAQAPFHGPTLSLEVRVRLRQDMWADGWSDVVRLVPECLPEHLLHAECSVRTSVTSISVLTRARGPIPKEPSEEAPR